MTYRLLLPIPLRLPALPRPRFTAALRHVVKLVVAVRNRHQVGMLLEFNDAELKDLGLVRNDVLNALDLPLHQDPSARLADWRAERGGGKTRP